MIERGDLLFTGTTDNPALDVRATREVEGATVGLTVTGTLRNPRSEIFSMPELTESEALARLPHESNRGRRTLLERATGNFLWDHRGRYGDRRDAALQTAERMGARDYPALREDVTGIPFARLVEAATETLRRTEDAYRDVLAYALKKLDPLLRPLPSGDGRRHDLQHALQAPWMDPFFRREDILPAVTRWLTEWGFHPTTSGRIRLDDEERPGKASRPFTAGVRVPGEVRLVVQRRAGRLVHPRCRCLGFAAARDRGVRPPADIRLFTR